ncbi:Mn2+/Fe2+ NRAMP family transporter [Halopolyspora algeriensis]|uniref:Mn2+/Fe2+ NRAMP family transporter n=1 Tax=Halopolyspora algeriensis TaxID=1500506 RepID=A0A368VY92_9ACTN|nr:Nramp family divalent metal transporter [Halopolyspora algeriensis]RCW45802.1 Mn2+/Fe2+ NRAMP family transporter [Halopolyspora algeriensis]TQM54186.1 Mn2+/Fe2+ NRAMP family transporter [Halopolyspora algeriensis]
MANATETIDVDDPYHLTPEGIQDPPAGWRASLRFFGPGLVLSAALVGAGELIATTSLGAEAGFALLWLVIVSTSVKVALQVELARWTISSGEPALTGFNKVPPHIGRIGWVNLLWIVLALVKIVQTGGLVGGVAAACSILIPLGSAPLGFTSLAIWTVIVTAVTIGLLYSNRYGLIERGAALLVVVFVLLTLVIAIGLPFTPLGYGVDDLAGGLAFRIPAGSLGIALAMFGLTGVGAEEITAYSYWCLEKGYARWSGPPDGSDAWIQRATGWITVMYKDAAFSWAIYTAGTLAFYAMGAAVLHPLGVAPEGNDMITTLSRIYTDTLGEWAGTLFLISAIAVLGSTLWAALPAWTRFSTNALALLGVLEWTNTRRRMAWIRFFTVAFPITWAAAYLLISAPVFMVTIGGIAGGGFLLAIVVAVWYLRSNETDPRLRGGYPFHVFLMLSSIAIILVGIYALLDASGVAVT